ncbi:hypothetical protein FA15DRAFT_627866 [Coprinopsis marcescibilis]|uniref:G-protein coupled receptors family 1 profile domain-containing protein n=1 Tax=Coprinopsis marcescibilis TaxID=230819 RepID=A0A5C3KEK8_COPMA|nr:hypothetical protein FA15DRAFT_627866 [Coprinopsis marcescibilis]
MSSVDQTHLAITFAETIYANITITLIDVGIQLFMCLYGLSVYLETPPSLRKGRMPYIIISFLILILSGVPAALDCAWVFRVMFEASSPTEYLRLFSFYGDLPLRFTSEVMFTVVVFVGDALLLYRCYVIWSDRKLVLILPTLAYLGGLGMGIRSLMPHDPLPTRASRSAWIFLVVSLNIMVTFLISFRLIRARRHLSTILPERNLNIYGGAVAILIESAFPLSIFGVAFAINMIYTVYRTTLGAEMTQLMLGMLFYSFTAISPQMIIFRVTTGRSWLSNPKLHGNSSVLSKPIVFAADAPTEQSFFSMTGPEVRDEERGSNSSTEKTT